MTETNPHDEAGGASSDGDGGTSAGTSMAAAGAGRGGSVIVQPTGGGGVGGTASEGGTAELGGGGVGGKPPDPMGGVAGELSCATTPSPPRAGPREDGPASISDCNGVSDELLFERFADPLLRVPRGLFFEPDPWIVLWNDPCSSSLDETAMRGPTGGMGVLESKVENNPWFYEASYCYMGVRRRERNLRCDYFDGKMLSDRQPDHYGLFASLLWWRDHANLSGAAILGFSLTIGDATDAVELCTIEGTRGDFGLCDEIRLLSTRHVILASGEVKLGSPVVLRVVNGNCH